MGKAWPISELAVFDDDGNRLAAGELGTVYMKMSTGGFSYHKDETKTRKNRIGDFFTVGDLGVLDEDGYLFLRDRKIDMIIAGGVNIYPAEIESALLTHPAVADAAVFGIPHADRGEEVKAVVEPADGHEPSAGLAAAILAHCEERLALLQTAPEPGLHHRDAPRPQRQALQTTPARTVLGGLRTASLRRARPQRLGLGAGWACAPSSTAVA